MKKMTIPHTDLNVSTLILGCMSLGGGWGEHTLNAADEQEIRAFLDTAHEIGANFFDHANIYSHGRAEEVFGRILKERPSLRDQIILQSKCGIRLANQPAGTPFRYDFSHDHIVESVEGILQRLSTDHLDILLLHRPDPLMEGEEVARAFAYLKKAGMVRYFGVSNQNRFQMEYLQSFLPDPLVANQMEMNILHNGFAEAQISVNQNSSLYPAGWEGIVEYCRLKGVGLQAWSPLARGLVSGRDTSGNERAAKATIVVSELSQKYGAPPEAIVLAWLLRHPAGIQPVIGTNKPDRLRACAKALELNLSREDWYKLFEAGRGAKVP